jgi:hypothetical protein
MQPARKARAAATCASAATSSQRGGLQPARRLKAENAVEVGVIEVADNVAHGLM